MSPQGRIARRTAGDHAALGDQAALPAEPAAALCCEQVRVGYGAEPVLDDLDLTVAHGESLALLGPSGSGKTTLLAAVAGFVGLDRGTIRIADEVIATSKRERPPEARDVGVVFQHYALWPHLTALETVAYPLRRRQVAADDARRQARDLLARLGLAEFAARRPAELSGGQQQRVGLARALATGAGLYLFDEPTAHLDAALKATLQDELSAQRRAAGAAAVHATHDAAEALAVADRVALLRDGRVVQAGTPTEVYAQPVDRWAAELTGAASVLDLEVRARTAGRATVALAGSCIEVAAGGALDARGVPALVRPDWAGLGGPLSGVVTRVAYRGAHTDYHLDTGCGALVVRDAGPPTVRPGERVAWHLERIWALPSPPPRS